VLWKLEGVNNGNEEKMHEQDRKGRGNGYWFFLKMKKHAKTQFETCQVCDEISLYNSICVSRTGIAGFCSVTLGARRGPGS